MRTATLVLTVFGALWGAMALSYAHAPAWTLAAPALLSLALAAAVFKGIPAEHRSAVEARRIGRVVALASTVEGLAILAGVNLVVWLGRPDLSLTVVAAVVGLHFLPLARWIPARVYYATAAGLLTCVAAGLAAAPPVRDVVVAGGAATVLWATIASFFVVRRPQAALA